MISDISTAKAALAYSLLTCILVTIIYSIFIYYFTPIIVWVSVVATGVAIVGLGYLMTTYYNKQYGPNSELRLADDPRVHGKYAMSIKYGQYVLYALAVAYFIALCCLWKAIRISISILKTTAVIIIKNAKLLIMPLMTTLLVAIWVFYGLYNLIYLLSSGTIT